MSKDIAVRLGRNIAEARKASGRTQAEVAEKVGIDTVSLSRIERGTVSPSITTLDRIADVLGEPLGRLFDGASSGTAALADDIAALLEPCLKMTGCSCWNRFRYGQGSCRRKKRTDSFSKLHNIKNSHQFNYIEFSIGVANHIL